MRRISSCVLLCLLPSASLAVTCNVTTSVLTEKYDVSRSGVQPNEAAINQTTILYRFHRTTIYTLSDNAWAQPLVCDTQNGTTPKLLVAADSSANLYGLDAAAVGTVNATSCPSAGCIWKRQLTASPFDATASDFLPNNNSGLIASPVIDPTDGYVYAEYQTADGVHHIGAWLVTTGASVITPVAVSATDSGSEVQFSSIQASVLARAGLNLNNGKLYVSYSSRGDAGTWYDWVLVYNASNLSLVAEYCGTCAITGGGGGMWGTNTIDPADGSLFLTTGNSITVNAANFNPGLVHLNGSTLVQSDWFAPSDYQLLTQADADIDSNVVLSGNFVTILAKQDGYGESATTDIWTLNKGALGFLVEGSGNPPVFEAWPYQDYCGGGYRGDLLEVSAPWGTDLWTACGNIARYHWLNNSAGFDLTGSQSGGGVNQAQYAVSADSPGGIGGSESYSYDGATQSTSLLWLMGGAGYSPGSGNVSVYEPQALTRLYKSGGNADSIGDNAKLGSGPVVVPAPAGTYADRVFVNTRSESIVAFGLTPQPNVVIQ